MNTFAKKENRNVTAKVQVILDFEDLLGGKLYPYTRGEDALPKASKDFVVLVVTNSRAFRYCLLPRASLSLLKELNTAAGLGFCKVTWLNKDSNFLRNFYIFENGSLTLLDLRFIRNIPADSVYQKQYVYRINDLNFDNTFLLLSHYNRDFLVKEVGNNYLNNPGVKDNRLVNIVTNTLADEVLTKEQIDNFLNIFYKVLSSKEV